MHQTILARAKNNAAILSAHRLRLIRSSSAPLYPPVWAQLEQTFGVPVLNAYGMTEAAHQISSVRLPGGARFHSTVGAAVGLEMAIMGADGALLPLGETGEVVLRGEQLTRGYLEPAGANETAFRDGWFRTGDEGVMDAEGLLSLTGRLKEMINSGGEKISPYEVEEALMMHPGISQAVAFSAPHALLGEQVVAAVVVLEGCSVLERDLLHTAARRLARCKMPRQVLFVPEIPRGATGKIQRIGLAARLGLN
jgi:acyl-CoA synthetase (AMP-forming)/AMP-acid ligase II